MANTNTGFSVGMKILISVIILFGLLITALVAANVADLIRQFHKP